MAGFSKIPGDDKGKAKIIPLDDSGSEKDPIEVKYNPTKYSVTISQNMSEEAADTNKPNEKEQFTTVGVGDLTVTLLYDTYEEEAEADKDVRKKINKIVELAMPTVPGKEKKVPPTCLFVWGTFKYKGYVSSVKQDFTMFLRTGVPVRANVAVTFKSAMNTAADIKKLKGLEACRKLWTVKTGDRLDLIANRTLKDVTQWRKIAELNGISDPISFPTAKDVGRRLVIPDIY